MTTPRLVDATGTVRLLDRMRAEGVMKPDGEWMPLADHLPEVAMDPERFIIDEVSDLYYRSPEGTWKAEDYVIGLPPFDLTWFEARAPKTVLIEREPISWHEFTAGMGVTLYGGLMATVRLDRYTGDEMRQLRRSLTVPEGAAHIVRTRMFVRHSARGRPENMIAGSFVHFTGEDGAMQSLASGHQWQYAAGTSDPKEAELMGGAMASYIDSIMLALNFMACVNIHDQPVHPQPALAKAFARRHRGQKLDVFRHLVIAPLLRPEGEPHDPSRPGHGGTGAGKRLHLVRGHFRHMPEVGASGRHYRKRLFWVRPHVRGDAEYGTVHKTYHIEPRDAE